MKVLARLAFVVLLFGCKEDHHERAPIADASTSSLGPVKNEMHLLTAALQTAVASIGAGDVLAVEQELRRVDEAKEATESAIHEGRYRPPKNGDKLDRFRELDEAFHGDLERLADASRRNDVPATASALGVVLQRCDGCHGEFRQSP